MKKVSLCNLTRCICARRRRAKGRATSCSERCATRVGSQKKRFVNTKAKKCWISLTCVRPSINPSLELEKDCKGVPQDSACLVSDTYNIIVYHARLVCWEPERPRSGATLNLKRVLFAPISLGPTGSGCRSARTKP